MNIIGADTDIGEHRGSPGHLVIIGKLGGGPALVGYQCLCCGNVEGELPKAIGMPCPQCGRSSWNSLYDAEALNRPLTIVVSKPMHPSDMFKNTAIKP